MRRVRKLGTAIAVFGGSCAVAGCAVAPPAGPSVMALPPQGKSLTLFQEEDARCRNYASAMIGYLQPGQADAHAVVGSAAIDAAHGAAAGSAIGGATGNAGADAATGGATGLPGGTAVGASFAGVSAQDLQQRYDIAYIQCMYSLGNTARALPGSYYADYALPYWYGWYGPSFVGADFPTVRRHHFHHGLSGHRVHHGRH